MSRGRIIFGKRGKNQYFVDDQEVTKEVYDKNFPSKVQELLTARHSLATVSLSSKAWPRLSDALGVASHQVEEARELMKKHGVPTDYNSKGQAIIRDNAHQRDLQKALGLVNFDGGYGSVTG